MSGILAALEVEETLALEVFKEGNKQLLDDLENHEADKNLSKLKLEAEFKVGAAKCSIKTKNAIMPWKRRGPCAREQKSFLAQMTGQNSRR